MSNQAKNLLTKSMLFFTVACGTLAGNPGGIVDKQSIILPDATTIKLTSTAESPGLSLVQSLCTDDNLGIFGFALGPICSSSNLVDQFLYGSNPDKDGDDQVTCADTDGEPEPGFLTNLLCNEDLIPIENITSLRFAEASEEFAISFLDFDENDDSDSKGSWTASAAEQDQYPANIAFWNGTGSDQLSGVLALKLADRRRGQLFLDFFPIDMPLATSISFGYPTSSETCRSNPSTETCFFQESFIKGPENFSPDVAPPGMHTKLYSNSKTAPTFFAAEIHIRYTESFAAAVFADSEFTSFLTVREIYIRMIQDGSELWGSFDFRNSVGETIEVNLNGVDLAKIFKDGFANQPNSGVCQDVGIDELKTTGCSIIDPLQYQHLWQGDAFETVATDYQIPFTFPEVPIQGLQTK